MKIQDLKAQDKHIRVSYDTWQKLRTAAFNQNSKIKTIFEKIMDGTLNPVTMEPLK